MSKPAATIDNKIVSIDPNKIKAGDIMSITYFVKVSRNISGQKLEVEDLDSPGFGFGINGPDLIKRCKHASQFVSIEYKTATELAQILLKLIDTEDPFRVEYLKKDGSNRVLDGKAVGHDSMGHVYALDLNLPLNSRMREVDTRTIQSLTTGNVKFVLKTKGAK